MITTATSEVNTKRTIVTLTINTEQDGNLVFYSETDYLLERLIIAKNKYASCR